ncbi:sigma-70 family RNA polymerase sigma factor [Marinobacterium mangrovicola]|uniref:Uncharacterized protein n=1 Tax=Marinobacterium mangrovicola TaxID=1476959 RepID=A0A4R1G8Q2_9GAMM|nr:sigma-70 family RNA polymerase sigma factor [Marinobacterium mangrovicola]TCK02973.1 hypothetical protein CLV83_4026 [Marinobacterium mangrovicola]
MEQKSTYLSADEFAERIAKLSSADYKRLLVIAGSFSRRYNLGNDPASLIQDAYERVWRGTRRIPRDVNIVKALGNIIHSIAGDHPYRKFGENESAFSDLGVDDADSWVGSALKPGPEEIAIAEQTIERIASHFENDTYVNVLIQAYSANMKQQQIIDIVFKGDRKTYEATRKRFRRGITKIQDEGTGL